MHADNFSYFSPERSEHRIAKSAGFMSGTDKDLVFAGMKVIYEKVQVGEWGPWECQPYCSATCGTGIKTCTRQCIGAKKGDLGCEGSDTKNDSCNTQPCPRNVHYRKYLLT